MTRIRCISPKVLVLLVSAVLCLAAGSAGAEEGLLWPHRKTTTLEARLG